MNPSSRFYSQPTYVGSINLPVYSGSRRQAGGSLFGSIKRAVVPTLKTAGKEMGRQALGLFSDVAQDVLSGEDIGESIKQRAKERAAEAARQGIRAITDTASQVLTTTALKRQAPGASRASLPPPKRRRVTGAAAQRSRVTAAQRRRPPVRKVTKQMRYRPKTFKPQSIRFGRRRLF